MTDSDAAVVVTEWRELADLSLADAGARMRRRIIVDGRNLYDPAQVRAAGFSYEGVGRPVPWFAFEESGDDVLPPLASRPADALDRV